MSQISTIELVHSSSPAARRVVAIVAGALLVAVSAQIHVALPGTPVPVTFQVPAVLVVGGLLGPRLGVASMVLYLMAGAAGLPVFAPTGLPGLARLIGPTGGYLLAFPLAAAVAGRLAAGTERRYGRVAAAMLLGFLVIHMGGVAQLAVISGDFGTALAWGSFPFLAGDMLKLLLAGLIVLRFASTTRARL